MRIHTSAELREIDRHAAEVLGVPTALLMENAGRAVAEAVRGLLGPGGRAFVVCGRGNNGGDGYVAARHLHAEKLPVFLYVMASADQLKGDAGLNARATRACGVREVGSLESAGCGDVVVDALLGTGLSRPVEGVALERIREMAGARQRGARVLSVDLPSGVDADRPHPPGEAVQADVTVTLHALKPALVQYPARALAGEVRVGELGIPHIDPPGPVRRWRTAGNLCGVLPRRAPDAHKGTNGHVLVVAGSPGKSGAAMLACRAALRGGAGLVTLGSAPEVNDRVLPQMPEVMSQPLQTLSGEALIAALAGKDVMVIGPGIARTEHTAAVLVELLRHIPLPTVIDADGLNALAGDRHALQSLDRAAVPPVLTPHPAELARLLETDTAHIQADRFAAASEASRRFRAVVVLKGAGSVLAHPDGSLDVCSSGNPAMATAGTGDALAGLCGALLAQGLAPETAALLAMYAHGRAGDLAADGRSRGMTAGDLIDRIPNALTELE